MPKPKAGINTTRFNWDYVFDPTTKARLHELIDFDESTISSEADPLVVSRSIRDAEVISSTWGALPYTAELLNNCPDLQLILYGAGSFKPCLTPELSNRKVTVCSAVHLNAVPTAEYVLGLILTSLKNVYSYNHDLMVGGAAAWRREMSEFNGGYYNSSIGILGFGWVARHLLRLLQPFSFRLYVDSDQAEDDELARFGAEKKPLEWIMSHCDVVSIHKADLPENRNLINRRNLALMKPGARLINTARGRLIDENDLLEKLRGGQITAFLDVTDPEPPAAGHPFYSLPNCILTPHIAGSVGTEVHRLGEYCLRELENWLDGRPLENKIDLSCQDNRA